MTTHPFAPPLAHPIPSTTARLFPLSCRHSYPLRPVTHDLPYGGHL